MRDGVAIIPIFDQDQTTFYRHSFRDMEFPEFIGKPNQYVMGGFGAYGNPASFHNPIVREMRRHAYPIVKNFLMRHFPDGYYLEQLFDRMCVRRAGTSTTRESWHRDISVKKHQDDRVFGGWINLDDKPQYFSCAIGTHLDHTEKTGFVRNDKPEQTATRVEIPSGHAILFFQDILHQVLPQRQKTDSFRLFQSFRISRQPESLFGQDKIDIWIGDQSTPLLPSGQHPPMYSSNHSSVFLFSGGNNDPLVFSHQFHSQCLISKICNGQKNLGRPYQIVHRFMTSLRDYQLALYPPYTDQDSLLFYPQQLKE